MKKAILAYLSLVLLTCVLRAEPFVGSTEAQARARYGEPVKQDVGPASEKVLTFEKNGIYIMSFFMGGRVMQVAYVRKDKRPFVTEEAEALVLGNAARWTRMPDAGTNQYWQTPNGTMMAINDIGPDGMLTIITRELLNARGRVAAGALKNF